MNKHSNPKKSNESQVNVLNNNSSSNGKKVNVINSNETNSTTNANSSLRNDTYESVCPPEDTAERISVAQRHTIIVNSNNSSSNAVNLNNAVANNNGRILKRVVSAPVAQNESKGM